MKFYIGKIVEAKNIQEALKKEKRIEPYDIRRTTETKEKVFVSTVGFASPEPLQED